MDLNKFTIKMQEAIERANQFAGEESHSELTSAHILIALLDQKEGVIRPLLEKLGVTVQSVDSAMRNVLSKLPKAYGNVQRSLSQSCYQDLNQAEKIASSFKDEYTSAEHFLLALVDSSSVEGNALRELGLKKEEILKALKDIRGNVRITNQDPEASYQVLEKYCKDLTKAAREEWKVFVERLKIIQF